MNTVDFFNYCYFYYYYFFLLLKALQSLEEEEGSVSACVLWVRERDEQWVTLDSSCIYQADCYKYMSGVK